MATARELFDAGNLGDAILQVTSEVKAAPADSHKRTFLFELLCFAGEYDRAERQLDVIGHQSAKSEIGVQVYRNNLKAERDRARLFSDGLQPHFLVEPPTYVDLHLSAINRIREGNLEEARAVLDRAEEERPAFTGRINGDQFLDFRDYNDLLGPVLEVIMAGEYTWLPFEQIKQISIESPRQLRDLIWTPARIEATDGTLGEVFIPALYSGSSRHPQDMVRLGRMTDWESLSDDLYIPAGLRLFLVDNEDRPMLAVRSIEFDAAAFNTQTAPS